VIRPPREADGVRLRDVRDSDLEVFYRQQREPAGVAMAAFPPRDRPAFDAHWAKIRAEPNNVIQTIELAGSEVAGNLGSWEWAGRRLLGYWLGQEFWGRGIATAALAQFVEKLAVRPLHAHVARENIGSIRVLVNCGFRPLTPDDVQPPPPDPDDDVEEVVLVLD
jgi:RimJ/RimL family protein N-acetyltransferase